MPASADAVAAKVAAGTSRHTATDAQSSHCPVRISKLMFEIDERKNKVVVKVMVNTTK